MIVDIRKPTFGSVDWMTAVGLRRAILRAPLGLDFSPDELAAEANETLFAAYDEGRLVGVVMMRPDGDSWAKLRQMAVVPEMRGRGVGEQLLRAFEAHARQIGIRHVGLAARVTARGFYECNGYVADGEVFIEVTIPHIHMSKVL